MPPIPKTSAPHFDTQFCTLTEDEWKIINDGLRLTAREMDVVNGILLGKSEAALAVHLGISINTVHTHLGRVYRKLGVCSASGLVRRVFAVYIHSHRRVTSTD